MEIIPVPLLDQVHLGLLPQAHGGRYVARRGEGWGPAPGATGLRKAGAAQTRSSGK